MMKKYFYFAIVLFLVTIFPSGAKALCSDAEVVRLSNLAKNININYTATEKNGRTTYNLIFTNLSNELVIKDYSSNNSYNKSGEMVLKDKRQGLTYKYYIYAKNTSCTTDYLTVKQVKMPFVNNFYDKDICKNLQDYQACRKYTNVMISYEDIEKVKNEVEKKQEEKVETINYENYLSKIGKLFIKFYVKYYYYIFLVIIIICCYEIYRENKKNDLG